MDINDLVSLEEQTKEIVETLRVLKQEVDAYQHKNLKIDAAFDGISGLSTRLTDATKDFLMVIELLKKSDLGNALNDLDAKIEKVAAFCAKIDDVEKRLAEQQREAVETFCAKIYDVEKRLAEQQREAVETFCTKIDDVEKRLAEQQREANDKISVQLNAIGAKLQGIQEDLTGLDARIGRIDRNTQKVFGKERG